MRVRPANASACIPENGQPPHDPQPRARPDHDVHVSDACLIPAAGPCAAAFCAPRPGRRRGAAGAMSGGDPQQEGNP